MLVNSSTTMDARGTETGETVILTLEGYHTALTVQLATLSEVATTFRDSLYLTVSACNTAVKTLQLVRQISTNCHQYWESSIHRGLIHPRHRYLIPSILKALNGQTISRLILLADTFKYLLNTTPGTNQDRERIRLHVLLQTQLAKKVATVDRLLRLLHEHIEAAQTALSISSTNAQEQA